MSRSQILIVVVAIALAAGIFFLPKVVVNEEDKENFAKAETTAGTPEGHSEDDGHNHGAEAGAAADAHATATPEQLMALATARAKYNKATDAQTRARFASELAAAYSTASKYDSAGYFYEIAAETRGGEKSYRQAGDAYYEAFSFAATQERANELGSKARSMYEQVLKNNPSDLDAKTNLAMTYVATTNPMQGIMLLREVIAADPNNEKALFNLGILSMQSGQYDKAVERFEKLVAVNPQHVEGTFYWAVALAETGQAEDAKALFNKVKGMSKDPALAASVDEYLAKLN
ncbi:tetratricopeptide repeat protein [Pontibacter ummariensis]|uniref:Tetratricopeptide repeat-containing protein n=1 Tax=Pontibacter ummariensis TaxID=1610492 RepID=A0A239JJ65_9BACT|nr:tetratricopeptide repeat protein [Pontibacter ummariensis]PRY07851.1 tetratricopeptide repeat protein [Pontibacter ummariensis]SNT06066.1 Tetratricopeptide repeat-containing protein [Pontibacter ummariensis]